MAEKKVYAVARGRATGIFTTWAECERHVKGFAGARYKSFTDVREALAWLSGGWKISKAHRSSSLPPWGRCPEGAERVTAYRDSQTSQPSQSRIRSIALPEGEPWRVTASKNAAAQTRGCVFFGAPGMGAFSSRSSTST